MNENWLTICRDAVTGVSVVVCDDEVQAKRVLRDELEFEGLSDVEIEQFLASGQLKWTDGGSVSIEIKRVDNVDAELERLEPSDVCAYAEFISV